MRQQCCCLRHCSYLP